MKCSCKHDTAWNIPRRHALIQHRNQRNTVASAAAVTGSAFRHIFRLFLEQCIHCQLTNLCLYSTLKFTFISAYFLLYMLHIFQQLFILNFLPFGRLYIHLTSKQSARGKFFWERIQEQKQTTCLFLYIICMCLNIPLSLHYIYVSQHSSFSI